MISAIGVGASGNRRFRGQEIGKSPLKIPTRSEPSVHTGQVSGIGQKSQIGISEFSKVKKWCNRKSRSAISR
jgi:hypothetical protein